MKRLLCLALIPLAAFAGTWDSYVGTKKGKSYPTEAECIAAAPVGKSTCRTITNVTKAAPSPVTIVNAGYSDARYRSIPAACLGPVDQIDKTQCDTNVWISWPSDIGAFRIPCTTAKYIPDDPLVYPGQPGASHLHAVYGNTGFSAASTQQSLSTTGNSTCAGGTLVRTVMWVPAMLDAKGPVLFDLNYYQKGSYEFDISPTVEEIPRGLRMLVGDAHNTDPNQAGALYACTASGNSGWQSTIGRAIASGQCVPGGTFFMAVNFPNCWDGVNLDSPDHKSHMSGVEAFDQGGGSFGRRCPATHPHVLPVLSYQLTHVITATDDLSKWHLSSDMGEPGTSGHGDYWANLDPVVEHDAVQHCIREKRDGHDNLTCGGMTLY